MENKCICKAIQISAFLLLISFVAVAQIQTKRIDPQELQSYLNYQSDKTPPRVTMKSVDISRLLEEDKDDKVIGLPPRFGKILDVDLGLENSGLWEEFPQGRTWKLQIHSPGAHSINLMFDLFYLPENVELIIYNEEKTMISGPITSEFNQNNEKLLQI